MFKFFKKKPKQESSGTRTSVTYAFGCYDHDKVVGMSFVKPDLYTKETICNSALPKALPQRMPVPPETVSALCRNLEYFEPNEWGAPFVTVNASNKYEGFDVDEGKIKTGIVNHLKKLGHSSEAVNLAYQMKVTVPFPTMGLYVIVLAMQK